MPDFFVVAAATIGSVLIAIAVVLAIRHLLITRPSSMSTTQTPHPRFDEHIKRMFVTEIAWQCDLALCSVAGLRQSLAALRSPSEERADTQALRENVWLSLQSLLIPASNISKMFWNSKEHIPGRGEVLRTALGVGEDSPLRSRYLRNHFEHYDERLEDWALKSKNRNLIDNLIGSPSAIQLGTEPTDYHRVFDPSTFTAWFWGNEYPLQPIIEEIQRIRGYLLRTASERFSIRLICHHPTRPSSGGGFSVSESNDPEYRSVSLNHKQNTLPVDLMCSIVISGPPDFNSTRSPFFQSAIVVCSFAWFSGYAPIIHSGRISPQSKSEPVPSER